MLSICTWKNILAKVTAERANGAPSESVSSCTRFSGFSTNDDIDLASVFTVCAQNCENWHVL